MKNKVYILNFLLFLLLIAFGITYINIEEIIYKSIASSCFLLAGIINTIYAYSLKQKNKFSIAFIALIVLGLLFGLSGDISINYNFIVGAILFAVGHIFYIIAYFVKLPLKVKDIVISASIFAFCVSLMTFGSIFEFNGLIHKIVCITYAFIISIMLGKAWSNVKKYDCVSITLAIGSTLFFFSDFMLLFKIFSVADKTVTNVLCLLTYFPAQFLISSSILLSVEKGMNIYKKIYCRIFQFCFKRLLPFLPYKNPKVLDKIEEIPSKLKINNKKNPIIITDKIINGLPVMKKFVDLLKQEGISFQVYDGVVANPTTDNVNEALKIYKDNNCDCLIAFGGGSSMDCAKAVGALIARPRKTVNKLKGILKVIKSIPLLIAIPTTAGTGSETTLAAVIVDPKTHDKYAINDFALIPDYAVLDEQTTTTLPKHIISTTGMDALTHAIESYIGRSGNRKTREDALDAAKLIFENLEKSYNGDKAASKEMLIASHKAGRSFSKAYVGYVHALAHALGGKYNIPHGLANAIILPSVLKQYGKVIEKKLWKLAVHCNLIDSSKSYECGYNTVINKIEELNKKFNIPTTFDQINLDDIDKLAKHADKEANPLYPVPVLWGRYELKEMYLKLSSKR